MGILIIVSHRGKRNGRVAGFTKRHQVLIGVIPAVGEWDDVMDFLCRNIISGFKATLAKRVLGDIQIADGAPTAVITLVRFRSAAVLIIPSVSLGRMLLAVQVIGLVEAAGNDTEPFRFVGHG